MTLAPHHLAELHEGSGIPLEVIAERGYQSVHTAAELEARSFSAAQARTAPGILMPIHGPDGSNGRYQFKPDRPRCFPGEDKPNKYESQSGLPNCLDVPVRCQDRIDDPSVDLFVTEGLKKSDSLAGIGKCAVGITGVWNWQKGHKLLPDWEPILPSLEGRRVFVVFDSDAVSNPNVRMAEDDLAINFLEYRGADAYIIRLPPGPNGEKVGVDDFLVAHGAAAFNKLIADTIRAARAENRDLKQQLHALAQLRRHKDVSSAELRVGWAVADELGWRRSTGKTGAVEVNLDRIADQSGMSKSTVGKSLERWADMPNPAFCKKVQWRDMPSGERHKVVLLDTPTRPDAGAADVLSAMKAAFPTKAPHGGKREPRCPDHVTAALMSREHLLHFSCGCIVNQVDALMVEVDEGAEPTKVKTQDDVLLAELRTALQNVVDQPESKTASCAFTFESDLEPSDPVPITYIEDASCTFTDEPEPEPESKGASWIFTPPPKRSPTPDKCEQCDRALSPHKGKDYGTRLCGVCSFNAGEGTVAS
ncbi:MAG TPA: DUF3854 domain-containing protein [Vicinamibacterales bacterium]|nr:DUF3854 domain-containing protein [Vicinamibacterales bacterium]